MGHCAAVTRVLGGTFMQFYTLLVSILGAGRDRLERRDETGATAVEYGLLVALIAAVIIVAVSLLGTKISSVFNSVAGVI